MGEQALQLEQGQLVADGRGPAVQGGVSRDRLGSDRLSRLQVLLHHLAQDLLLPWGEDAHRSIVGAAARTAAGGHGVSRARRRPAERA